MRAIIIGGGIGGLTTALALHAAGIEAEVFESAPEIRPLGVGVNLQPHAVRELTELGLGEELAATGIATQEFRYANRFGQTIWTEPRGLAAGYHWPQYSIHRGRLQVLLWRAAEARLGTAHLRAGKRLTGFAQDASGVTARFADGSTAQGDLLIAADGIHSTVRAHYHPDEGPPKWNGALLWRATSWAPAFLTGASMVQAGHRDTKFVCYPIAKDEGGRLLVNWIAEQRFPTDTPWAREDWNRPGRIEDFLPIFAGWNFGWLDVPALIHAAEAVYEFPMVDRDPLPRWTHGRVTLLGDAAHPMYPIGSNGASQAILDARFLALQLATQGSVEAGLEAYEAVRRPATAAVVEANRGDGPDRVMDIVHARAPEGFARLEDVVPHAELEAVVMSYKRTAGFDPETLNRRESWSVPRHAGLARD
ncbi:flavin-dependent oxidoreductase [Paracraurococcus lichenis]|uniref:Flavin-dependent oxidoreductase n=1 Tax=Paracraurococcus lichenis TaxID=3064888 RepID=A0ABT9E015_9PROT|nr:flavin-dependent oxidoreductase [Paracraurococcus sp. LOR1-02]MDO9709502.1 flavin-dependent oxidoreductase [Paracraurococcus sp. LOR1-02]